MVKQFTEESKISSVSQDLKQFKSHCIDLAKSSQKFILPDGGRLYDDPEYKALDETVPLSLPYPMIAIEYTRSNHYISSHKHCTKTNYQPTKALLFARERDDSIAITIVVWADFAEAWVPYPEVAIPRVNYIDRSNRMHGYAAINVYPNQKSNFGESTFGNFPGGDYADEIGSLLCLLNVLQCKNVHIEKSEPKSLKKTIAAGRKKALPFDTYHLLTISVPSKSNVLYSSGGSHRSPREHLRRGHIRLLSDRRKVWVNATVVAAGRGSGVVTKDYAVRCAA